MKYYISACLIIRDNIDLLEPWLQYHFFIGFEHIYLIDHNSNPKLSDYASVNNYIKQSKITYIHSTTPAYQRIGYNHVLNTYRTESQWIAYIDSDEYIVLKKHNTIGDFIKNYEDFAAVSIGWYLFVSNNQINHKPNLFETYTIRHALSCHYKTIVQTAHVIQMDIHNVSQCINNKIAVDEAKVPVSGYLAMHQHTDYVQVNHYVIRSFNDFKNKNRIGSGLGRCKPLTFFDAVNNFSATYCDAILQFIARINFKLNIPSYDHFKYIAKMEFNTDPNEIVTSIVNKLATDPNIVIKVDMGRNVSLIPYVDIINRFYPNRLINGILL